MMTPKNIKARTAIEYFNKGYYNSGKWLGKGAEALGLKGEITDIQVYENIIKGLSLDGTQKLIAREVHEDKRKAAVDCTFAAPKSFSYCALVLGDSRLVAAHNKVLEEKVLPLMEARYAQTRVMFNGKTQEVVKTGNMVIAKYDHFESRELDFHVHSHCLVMNTTQMPNGEWYSHLNDGIFTHQKVLGMAYQHGLAKEVQKLGYEIEWRDHGQFEIKGLTEQQRMNFSKRRQQILASAGVDASWSERERVWKKTRRNKELVPLVELQKRWGEEAQALGMPIITPNQPESPVNHLELEQPQPELELKIFNDAIAHCSEKRVAFRAEDLEKFILEHSKQAVDITKIQSGIDNNAELIKLDEATEIRYTTQTAVLRELATNKMMQQGQRSLRSITHPEVVEHHLAQTKLNQGQRQAVMLALTTNNQVIGWQGVAGAGKTYALEQVKALAEARSYVVKGLAPSAKASRILEKELNSPTQTVARFLNSKLPVQIEPNQIWAVDEAGLLSAKDCHRLLKRARQERARIILVGDIKQLSAVEAGAPFKSLQQAGMKTAYLTESQRQKEPKLKLAVDLLAEGRTEEGFNRLQDNGCIQTVTTTEKIDKIVQAYLNLTPDKRIKTLLLAGTHDERRKLTDALRQALQADGALGDDVKLTLLKAKDLSDVEKEGYIDEFAIGDVVMPLRDYKRKNLTKGEVYEIVGLAKDHLYLKASDGTQLSVGLDFKKAVFERQEISIAVGDRLMWKKNTQALAQVNGEEVVVKALNGSLVEIEESDGKTRTIDLNQPHHLDHAIVRTTYSSQGETADTVLIAADSTIGKESFYVAASRAKLQVCFFTEDPKRLLQWAQHSKAQENSLELLRQQLREEMALLQAVSVKSSSAQSQVAVMQKSRLRNKVINETKERLEAKLVGQQPINEQHLVKPKEQINDFNPQQSRPERAADGRESSGDRYSPTKRKDYSTTSYVEAQTIEATPLEKNKNEPFNFQQPGKFDGASTGNRAGELASECLESRSRTTRPDRGLDRHPTPRDWGRVAASAEAVSKQAEPIVTQTSPRIRANSDRLRELGIQLRDELRNTECSQQTADRTTERVVERSGAVIECSGAANTTTRRSFNRAGEINRSISEHRESVKALADSLREMPLEDVAAQLGLKIDRHDKHKWKGEGQIVSINDQKFYDHLAMKGGYGAIDLVMHIQEQNFKKALEWLSNGITELPPPQWRSPQPKAQERQPFHPPIPDENKWQEARQYLVQERGLPAKLVDELHSSGKIYATGLEPEALEKLRSKGYSHPENITNAVFLRQDLDQNPTGASLRGVSDNSQFKGLATGSYRHNGWFSFIQGEGHLKRIVLVESSIDAMSAAALAKQPEKTMFMSTDGAGSIPTKFLQQQLGTGTQVIVAYDADKAGEEMAQKVIEALPTAIRAKPSYGKDWNEQLLQQKLLPQQLWQQYSQNADPNRPLKTASIVALAAINDGHSPEMIHKILKYDPELTKIRQSSGEEMVQKHLSTVMRSAEARIQKHNMQHCLDGEHHLNKQPHLEKKSGLKL